MRQKVYDDDMEEEIDVFDLECKEWGFCLRELFGLGLGTGDYGHLTVEHASMLLRNFRSLRHYSNQGFEAAHKLQKQIFSRATNHDGSGEATSLDQILTHQYAEKFLYLRLCFRNAKECARKGKKFYFRGRGWKNSVSTKRWSATHKRWIEVMDETFTTFLGKDYLSYEYTENLCCIVTEDDHPTLEYDDSVWENTIKQKMTEREWLEKETPRARKAKKGRIPKKLRRKLFRTRKGKRKSCNSSAVSSHSSGTTYTKKSSPIPYSRKRKLSYPKRKPSSSTSDTTAKSQESHIPKTRRCLFKLSNRKRKQETPLKTSPPKHRPSATPSASASPPPDSSGLLLLTSSGNTSPPVDSSGLPSPHLATTPPPSCSNTLPSFSYVFSSTCTREQLLTCKLPPVDCSITVQQNRLVKVHDNSVYANVTGLKERPPACVVEAAVTLMRKETKRADKTIDLEVEDNGIGVSIGQLGIFSRAGLGRLEWLGEIATMQCNVQEEKKWVVQTPDNLDDQTREVIVELLYKFPLDHLVASEDKYSVNVRAFSKLALERYIDDTVIDTAIARMHRQYNLKETVLWLPAHTMTWLDTGDEGFIRECFRERLLNVKPDLLSLILVPVNMNNAHWGLMIVDVQSKEAYFDDGLGWAFPRISYVHLIIRELHFKFPECDYFSLKDWLLVKAFERFGMPKQPTDGRSIGSGSCGVGVILSAQDFMTSHQPRSTSPSWRFEEMTVHRKEIMKLLSSK